MQRLAHDFLTTVPLGWIAEKGGDPEAVRRSQRRRFEDVAPVDVVVEQDAVWRRGETRRREK
eukprot:354954-Chlamydomonas_euryale.AAC.12